MLGQRHVRIRYVGRQNKQHTLTEMLVENVNFRQALLSVRIAGLFCQRITQITQIFSLPTDDTNITKLIFCVICVIC